MKDLLGVVDRSSSPVVQEEPSSRNPELEKKDNAMVRVFDDFFSLDPHFNTHKGAPVEETLSTRSEILSAVVEQVTTPSNLQTLEVVLQTYREIHASSQARNSDSVKAVRNNEVRRARIAEVSTKYTGHEPVSAPCLTSVFEEGF